VAIEKAAEEQRFKKREDEMLKMRLKAAIAAKSGARGGGRVGSPPVKSPSAAPAPVKKEERPWVKVEPDSGALSWDNVPPTKEESQIAREKSAEALQVETSLTCAACQVPHPNFTMSSLHWR
jgi:hypothetical protein